MRADALLAKFLQTQRDQRLLIATRDDLAAVYAKNAIEMNRRQSDCIFVSQGSTLSSTAVPARKRRSTPTTGAAWCGARSPTTWTRCGYDVLPLACVCLPARRPMIEAAQGGQARTRKCARMKLSPPAEGIGNREHDELGDRDALH